MFGCVCVHGACDGQMSTLRKHRRSSSPRAASPRRVRVLVLVRCVSAPPPPAACARPCGVAWVSLLLCRCVSSLQGRLTAASLAGWQRAQREDASVLLAFMRAMHEFTASSSLHLIAAVPPPEQVQCSSTWPLLHAAARFTRARTTPPTPLPPLSPQLLQWRSQHVLAAQQHLHQLLQPRVDNQPGSSELIGALTAALCVAYLSDGSTTPSPDVAALLLSCAQLLSNEHRLRSAQLGSSGAPR